MSRSLENTTFLHQFSETWKLCCEKIEFLQREDTAKAVLAGAAAFCEHETRRMGREGGDESRAEFEQSKAKQSFFCSKADFLLAQQSKAEFEQSRAEFGQSRAEFEQSRAEFEQSRAEFGQSRAAFEQSRAAFEQSRAEFEQNSAEFCLSKAEFEQSPVQQSRADERILRCSLAPTHEPFQGPSNFICACAHLT